MPFTSGIAIPAGRELCPRPGLLGDDASLPVEEIGALRADELLSRGDPAAAVDDGAGLPGDDGRCTTHQLPTITTAITNVQTANNARLLSRAGPWVDGPADTILPSREMSQSTEET
ncbi:MAG: hypothetical protein ACR2IE_14510 [Candidatus Sumerlaeaceae bacterium]